MLDDEQVMCYSCGLLKFSTELDEEYLDKLYNVCKECADNAPGDKGSGYCSVDCCLFGSCDHSC